MDWYYSPTPIPLILHASRESRIEALRSYELLEMKSGEKVVEYLTDPNLSSYATGAENQRML
jgi:hypothetical protein